ncbi:hypothetical protein Tdes44962_MAKER08263 [Teratosphaeria destructans]|uniref:Uncharacterized protein n=1 Tax=Teratosphaeria destructans TaxID=418781 RepID=A0A9W7W4R0_9PEZI|nr:hypothetical protein Tdes44962_MAKER08263 [Teratosphaeria destructans]
MGAEGRVDKLDNKEEEEEDESDSDDSTATVVISRESTDDAMGQLAQDGCSKFITPTRRPQQLLYHDANPHQVQSALPLLEAPAHIKGFHLAQADTDNFRTSPRRRPQQSQDGATPPHSFKFALPFDAQVQ